MAATRSRSNKRKKRRPSRLPALVLITLMLGVGGLLIVSAQNSPSDEGTTSDNNESVVVDPVSPTDSNPPPSDAPIATIGSVAPPVSVDPGDDDNDGDQGLVLDDFTPTETPQPPTSPRTVPSDAVVDGAVTGTLADGYYLGFLDGLGDSTSILVRFDTRSGPVFDAPIEDLLFVSLRVDARDPSHPGSAVLSPRTLYELLAQGDPTFTIPDTDDLVVIDGSFLVTVADGRAVGIEAVS